ncbi:MAG: glycoside hydrolase family 3 C-terminal domain-containing protein [Muribaculaceae bacterium]|nr:glycoside hydrolase family 3 C-terminal domain-containing protein [Muribaculaceae bacterium]
MKKFLSGALLAMLVLTGCGQKAKYKDKSLSPQERAEDLISRLTLEEKVSLMMDVSPAIPRLDIPQYNWWNEALHGVGRAGIATVLPQSIGMAATFDDMAVKDAFTMVSDEARAKYNEFRKNGSHERYEGLTFWTPNINIFRDPRWGRGQETYGEDPYLTSMMGVAVVEGLQGDPSAEQLKTIGCAKHFAVHSGPEWSRHSYDAKDIDPADLWETYLPAFKALVDAGVGQVMCAYNRYEGDPCCGSNRLLTQILRDEWGYDKIVVSDCWALNDFFLPNYHETHKDGVDASAAAVRAGTDLECGPVFANLVEAVDSGYLTEADIDKSLKRLLTTRFALGEMDENDGPWSSLSINDVDTKENRQLALDMARKSMTLLKNNGILPLKKGSHVVIMGPNADDSVMQWGNYNGFPSHTVTILDGVNSKTGSVNHISGIPYVGKADTLDMSTIDAVKNSTVIFVGGLSPLLEGEEMPVNVEGFRGGDRETIELPRIQREIIKKLKGNGNSIVYVNCSGSAVALSPEAVNCDAILQAWYPGEEGGTAVADVLFGDYNPAGRLPVTFYANDSQLPDFEDYSMEGRTYRFMKSKPLYPFGHGLSYSKFTYGTPILSDSGNEIKLTVPVKNESNVNGEEVVQLYIAKEGESGGPIKTLRAFRRVPVNAGVVENVEFILNPEFFATFDFESQRMKTTPGKFKIYYGGSSNTTDYINFEL